MRIARRLVWTGVLAVLVAGAQPRKKQVRDAGEQELYNQAIHAEDPAARVRALDEWAVRYPASDYKDDRLYFYMQAYSKTSPPNPSKVLEYGELLLARDVRGGVLLNALYLIVSSAATLPQGSPAQLATGRKAGSELLQLLGTFPAGSDPNWPAARADIERRTRAAMVALTLAPGNRAMDATPPDCAAASTAYAAALKENPELALASFSLGKALACEGRTAEAIYQFLRAAEIDPTLGGSADPAQIAGYADGLYRAYRGSADGLAEAKALAKKSPVAPETFRIETAAQMSTRRQGEFALANPDLARWLAMRQHLLQSYGAQYFEGQLKGETLSLKGVVVEGRPACRPKELWVAADPGGSAEILLRLDSAPAGVVVRGEIEFTGVPRAFTADPLVLTMDVPRMKITNLKIGPCTGQ